MGGMKRPFWFLAIVLFGCTDEACDDLAAICELCPDDEDGRVARSSCLRTVEADDAVACEERIDQRTYAPYGCR
jgi:hypothetical protein